MARPNRGSGTRAFGGLVIERETGRARTRHPREQRGAGAAQRRQDVADDRRNRPRGRFEIVAALHRAFEKFAFGNRAAIIAVPPREDRSEEHTSELQSLMRISYAVFCL